MKHRTHAERWRGLQDHRDLRSPPGLRALRWLARWLWLGTCIAACARPAPIDHPTARDQREHGSSAIAAPNAGQTDAPAEPAPAMTAAEPVTAAEPAQAACTDVPELESPKAALPEAHETLVHPWLRHYRDVLRPELAPAERRALDAVRLDGSLAIDSQVLAQTASLFAATRVLPLVLRSVGSTRASRVASALERQRTREGIEEALIGVRGQYNPSGIVIGHEPECERAERQDMTRCTQGDAVAIAVMRTERMLDASPLEGLAALLELLEAARQAGTKRRPLERRMVELHERMLALPRAASQTSNEVHPLLLELRVWLEAALPDRSHALRAVDLSGTLRAPRDALLVRAVFCARAALLPPALTCVEQLSDTQTEFDAYVGAPSARAEAAREHAAGRALLERAEQLVRAAEPSALALAALAIERFTRHCGAAVGPEAPRYLDVLAAWARDH